MKRILLSLLAALALFGQGGFVEHADAGRFVRGTRSVSDVTPPTLYSAAVADATPGRIDLTWSEPINSTVSAASAFTVSAGHTLTAHTYVDSTHSYLTTSTDFVNGEAARTLSYTQPGSNKMQDLAGNLLANFSGTAITNNVAAVGASAITSSVVASRTSCTAPCFVFFDATGTTSSDSTITDAANGGAFRQITHVFDYGDTGAGTWAYTGLSKNSSSGGPLGAHIYESAGTYTVYVTSSHAGTTDKVSSGITITVADPDTVYAGSNTVCVNGTGTSDGLCPAGGSYASSIGTPASNKRYLLKRGGTYSAAGELGIGGSGQTGIRIGAYGTGAKPIIAGAVRMGENNSAADIVLMDVEVNKYVIMNQGSHLVSLRVDVTNPTGPNGFYFNETAPYLYMKTHAIVDCTADDPGKATMIGGAFGVMAFGWVAGFYTPHVYQHEVRIRNGYKVLIEHNKLPYDDGYGGTGHSIKFHAQNFSATPTTTVWDEVSSTAEIASTYGVIRNNVLHSTTSDGNWTVEVAPENTSYIEGVSDVIIENNLFYRGTSGSSVDIQMGGRRITQRGNTRSGGSLITNTSANGAGIPSGWDGPYFSN